MVTLLDGSFVFVQRRLQSRVVLCCGVVCPWPVSAELAALLLNTHAGEDLECRGANLGNHLMTSEDHGSRRGVVCEPLCDRRGDQTVGPVSRMPGTAQGGGLTRVGTWSCPGS